MKVKNWAKYQHFKDRKPLWIKLYRDLLDDIEWHRLDGDSAKLLVSLWLMASENAGELPDIRHLAFRLRLDERVISDLIKNLDHWLISTCYQDDINLSQKITVADIEVPRREEKRREEIETEKEEEKIKGAKPATVVATPDGVCDSVWQDFKKLRLAKKAPITETALRGIASQAQQAGLTLESALSMCCERGWTSIRKSWLEDRSKSAGGETFKERDARNGRAAWEKMTGEVHPDNLPQDFPTNTPLVIDAPSTMYRIGK